MQAVPGRGCNLLRLLGSSSPLDPLEAASRPRPSFKDHTSTWGCLASPSLIFWPLSLLASKPQPQSLLFPLNNCGWPITGKALNRPANDESQLPATDNDVSVLEDKWCSFFIKPSILTCTLRREGRGGLSALGKVILTPRMDQTALYHPERKRQ